MTDIILLAYSGSEGHVVIPWLKEQFGAEVITLTLDLGQGSDLVSLRETALAAGAARAHVIDAREEFARSYVLPSLQADALRAGQAPLAQALGTAAIAERLVDVARMEGARAVAYGNGRTDPSVKRLEVSILTLEPHLTIIQLPPLTGPDVPGGAPHIDANLWGRSIARDPPDARRTRGDAFTLTRVSRECPNEAAFVEIEFDGGVPFRANGIEMSLLELIESLEIIAGAHGVGRIAPGGTSAEDLAEHCFCEAPAAVVLHEAHRALEAAVIPDELWALKRHVASTYVDLVEAGRWFSPAREALAAFVASIQRRVTGTVRIELFKTHCRCLEVHAGDEASASRLTADVPPSPADADVHDDVALGADRSPR
jgi:argininosuccinate synthase